jgi:hypothetical protein
MILPFLPEYPHVVLIFPTEVEVLQLYSLYIPTELVQGFT